jgi:cell division protein FtsB
MTTLLPAAPRSAALGAATGGLGVRRAMVRLSRLLVLALVLALMGGLGILQVLQSSHVATLGYQLRTLEQDRSELSAEVGQLEAQVATRSNLEQVHSEAVNRLGMVPPTETVHIQVAVPAPAVVPLPRRYVASTAPVTGSQTSWWERLLTRLPGFN